MIRGFVFALVACAGMSSAAYAGFANEYAVFGNDSLTFLGFARVSGGPAGSNGDVHHAGGSAQFDALRGGGSLNPTPPTAWTGRQNVFGDVVFNGPVTINALSDIGGSVHSGGAINIGLVNGGITVGGDIVGLGPVGVAHHSTISGSIISGGNMRLDSGGRVAGNIGANGNVTLGVDADVAGIITHSGVLTKGSFSDIGGQVVGTVTPEPQSYQPIELPPATAFTAGGANIDVPVLGDRTLAPGSYGAMTLNGANDVYLSSGNYYFTSIASPGTFLDLHLDLGGGPINIFVTGDVEFTRVTPIVNGVTFADAEAALAAQVYLESHGDIHMTGRFFGALHAPYGDITTGTIGAITGSLIAGHNVVIGSSTSIQDASTTYVPSLYLASAVPEPGSVMLGFMGLALAGLRRRR